MFGACRLGVRAKNDADEDDPGHPKRYYEGQRREVIVKQAVRVSTRALRAKIAEIEEELSDEERKNERRSAELADIRKNKEGGIKDFVAEKTFAGRGSQMGDILFDRRKSLSKMQEAPKRKQLETSVQSSGELEKSTSGLGGLKMPLLQSPMVVVDVIHPCAVSLLRSKLHKMLGIPLEHIRVVHRREALKDENFVPVDTVDLGEQDGVDDVAAGDCPDLDYLWVIDTRTLQPPSPSEDAITEDNKEDAASKKQGAFVTDLRNEATSKFREDEVKKEVDGHPFDVFEKQLETAGPSNEAVREQGPSGDPVAGSEVFLNKQPREEEGRSTDAPDERVKQRRGRLVPGSLLLTSVSVSDLSGKGEGVFSEQDLYLVVKWSEQKAHTTVKRSSSNNCSWPGEELVLPVRSKKQLQESVRVELWDGRVGHEKPCTDDVIGKDTFSVKHLAQSAAEPANVDAGRDAHDGPMHSLDEDADDEARVTGMVLKVTLEPGEEQRRRQQRIEGSAGIVMMTLTYIPPRLKPPKPSNVEVAHSETGTVEDPAKSVAGKYFTSDPNKLNKLSFQELEAFMAQKLEGFDIREELTKIGCQRYAEGLIREGFGQRGAFAHVQEKHMTGHPIYMPRGARKRVMALSEFTRLQMKAEEGEDMTAIETIKQESKAVGGRYTVDGKTFFDTMTKLRASLREGGRNEPGASVGEEDLVSKLKPRKPPTTAKEKIIRAIEAAAAAEERGIFKSSSVPKPSGGGGVDGDGLGDGRRGACCEKHASMIQRSAMKRVEERVHETVEQANTWLEQADRSKSGELSFNAACAVMRDTLVFSGLPSPRESDVRIHLERVSRDSPGPQLDRCKLGQELQQMVRRELCSRSDVPYNTPLY